MSANLEVDAPNRVGKCCNAGGPEAYPRLYRREPTPYCMATLSFGHGGIHRGVMEQRLRDIPGFQIGDGIAQIMKTIVACTRAGRAAVPA